VEGIGSQPTDWPPGQRFYLTLDLECDFGTALSPNAYAALENVEEFAAVLERHGTPLTCFVQTEVLEQYPETVESLRDCDVPVTFHPHSHTHRPRSETSVESEVRESTERYREFFGRAPDGYRFPNGNVRPADLSLLAEHDYQFDASVFPSWRPGMFDNRDATRVPVYYQDVDLYELPFTVYSQRIQVPTALSYCRLLGRPFVSMLRRLPPQTVVFNVHLHDLRTPETVEDLSPFYRVVYRRNDRGFELLSTLLQSFEQRDYQFETLDSLHEGLRARRNSGMNETVPEESERTAQLR
jgi:peptidoglycan/xylan/chitin deacetylase (PgdA/CDA1 family)